VPALLFRSTGEVYVATDSGESGLAVLVVGH
jgi:hypothetical protein